MSTAQRMIKYIALAFAVFLIFQIISCLIFGVTMFADFAGLNAKEEVQVQEDLQDILPNIEKELVQEIDLEIAFSNLTIKEGTELKLEGNSNKIKCSQVNHKLTIKEDGGFWSTWLKTGEPVVVLTLPKGVRLENVKLKTGTGKVSIENLRTKKLRFEMGVGEVKIENINVSKEAKITAGIGNFQVKKGEIQDLKLSTGIGEATLKLILKGDTKIDAGIGKVELTLEDGMDNYEMKINKGIGRIRVNGEELEDGKTYGTGSKEIKISGGIGELEIK